MSYLYYLYAYKVEKSVIETINFNVIFIYIHPAYKVEKKIAMFNAEL